MACIFEGAWRLFFHSPVSIREQMAWDEMLLQGVHEKSPALCFYDIQPVTVSLGAFQKVAATFVPERFGEYQSTFVRRPTGGQALLHKRAIVFSVIVSREHFIPFRKKELYLAFAPLFIDALTALGIPARIHFKPKLTGAITYTSPHPSCFAGPGEYEVVSGAGQKLVGSAQIITREGCLQQNFIPLDNSYQELESLLRPELTGPAAGAAGAAFLPGHGLGESTSLAAAAGRTIDFLQVQAALVTAFRQQFKLEESAFSAVERESMQKLLAEKYSQERWNCRF